jgi:hypothetical protein
MNSKEPRRPDLRLIHGAAVCKTSLGTIQCVAAPKETPPFRVDAIAYEEDTFLVLSADPTVRDPKVPFVRIMTRLIETQPETPGRVLVRGKTPLMLLAVIHDLNQEPSWKEEWIETALKGIFQESERRRLGSIALPLMGTVHGTLDTGIAVDLIVRVLGQCALKHLCRLWLIVPAGAAREIIGMIERAFQGPNT